MSRRKSPSTLPISQLYIDMTVAMMKSFGIDVFRRKDEATGRLLDIYDIPKGNLQESSRVQH